MRVTDRLIQDTKKRSAEKKRWNPETEETLTYQVRKKTPALNEEPGVFFQKTFEGINTQKSVFDRTARFHTGKQEKD